jgi:hypothetical protein
MSSKLELLKILIDTCKELSSDNDRYQAFSIYGEPIRDILSLVMDKSKKFGIKTEALLKYRKEKYPQFAVIHDQFPKTLIGAMDACMCTYTGHKRMEMVAYFLEMYPNYERELLRMFNKDLEIGVGSKTAVKQLPGMFFVYSDHVALAENFNKVPKMQNALEDTPEKVYDSLKIDGLRTNVWMEDGNVIFKSRHGKVFQSEEPSLDSVREDIFSDFMVDYVLDGELVVENDAGDQFFRLTSAVVDSRGSKKKGKDRVKLENDQFLVLYVFDIVRKKVFTKDEEANVDLSCRWETMKGAAKYGKHVRILQQNRCDGVDYEALFEATVADGGEGRMFRYDCPYQHGRKWTLSKRKKEYSEEYIVSKVSTAMKKLAGRYEKQLIANQIHFDLDDSGTSTTVVPCTNEQKIDWAVNPENIIGRKVTITFNEKTENKKGIPKLRFPRLSKVWSEDGSKVIWVPPRVEKRKKQQEVKLAKRAKTK